MRRKICTLVLLLICIGMFTACGKAENTAEPIKNTNKDLAVSDFSEYCYTAEMLETGYRPIDFLELNNSLYILAREDGGSFILLKDNEILCTFDGSVNAIESADNGDIWAFESFYKGGSSENVISLMSPEGEIKDTIELDNKYSGIDFEYTMKFSSGKLYIISEEGKLLEIDAQTKDITEYPLPGKSAGLAKAADSGIYIAIESEAGTELYTIENGALKSVLRIERGTVFDGAGEDFLLLLTEDGLNSVSKEGNISPIIKWDACQFSLGQVYEIIPSAASGEFICNTVMGLYRLKPAAASEYNARTELKIAAIGQPFNLLLSAAEFNNTSSDYYARIIDYSANGELSNEQAENRLKTEIISGEIPDMICFNNISPYTFILQDMLVDINTLLAEDTEISAEDIAIRNALDISGKIYFLGNRFALETLVAKYSEFGDRYGWTIDEFLSADAAKPESMQIMYNMTREKFLKRITNRYLKTAIDWDNGTCSFNNEDFVSILNASRKITENPEDPNNMVYGYGPTLVGSGELYTAASWMTEVWKLKFEEQSANEELSCIGWPTVDGSCGSDVYVKDPVGILNCSSEIDGCWEFVKFMLQNYVPADDSLPVYMPLLRKEFDDAKNSSDLQVTFDDRDGDKFLNLLDNVNNAAIYDNTVQELLKTNLNDFLNGKKSAEETADAIQTKISLFLNEHCG